jgi:hypothetical protein
VVEGAQVAYEETMAARLGPALGRARRWAARSSLSTPGWPASAPASNSSTSCAKGQAYQPDLVVLVFTIANDVADNSIDVAKRAKLPRERRPYFALGPMAP